MRTWPGQAVAPTPCGSVAPIGRWRNGVALLEARASGEWRGSGGWIELCYRAETEQRGADYHWFNHVIGPDGQRRAQIDGVGYPADAWRAGDVIRVRFGPITLPPDTPPGRYTVQVGMYTYPDIVNVSVIDAVGNPAGDAVSIELGELSR